MKSKGIQNRLKNHPILLRIYRESKSIFFNIFIRPVYFLKRNLRRIDAFNKYKDIKDVKDRHLGKRCFIIGSGPSLTEEDYLALKDEYTFGVNAICMLFDKLNCRTDYMVISDWKAFNRLKEYLPKDKSVFVADCETIDRDSYSILPTDKSSAFSKYSVAPRISNDASICVYHGNTVVFVALQLAIYMGFKEIYLLGVDCNYSKDAEKWYSVDHGLRDENNDTAGLRMINDFKVANKWIGKYGVEVFNATRGGMLEVFPRVDLDDILKDA